MKNWNVSLIHDLVGINLRYDNIELQQVGWISHHNLWKESSFQKSELSGKKCEDWIAEADGTEDKARILISGAVVIKAYDVIIKN